MACKSAGGFASTFSSQVEELAIMPYSFHSNEKSRTCSPIFWLNYGATGFVLLAASLMVTLKQFGGRPIECVVSKDIDVQVVNNFCWIHSTYSSWTFSENSEKFNRTEFDSAEESVPEMAKGRQHFFVLDNDRFKLFNSKPFETQRESFKMAADRQTNLHSSGPYPGVETTAFEGSFSRYHKYAQWVPGILILQAEQQQNRG